MPIHDEHREHDDAQGVQFKVQPITLMDPKPSPRRRGKAHAQTGPKTPSGKARSAKNALRHALYVASAVDEREAHYLHTLSQAMYALTEQHAIDDHPMLSLLIRNLALTQARIERLYRVEAALLATWDAHPSLKSRWCRAADIPVHEAESIPAWYFFEPDCEQKQEARELAHAHGQIEQLLESPDLLKALEHGDRFQGLRSFIHRRFGEPNESTLASLKRHFDGNDLQALIENLRLWLEHLNRWELRWGQAQASFQKAADHVQAQITAELLAEEKRHRLMVSLHRQMCQKLSLLEHMRTQAWAPDAENLNKSPQITFNEHGSGPPPLGFEHHLAK